MPWYWTDDIAAYLVANGRRNKNGGDAEPTPVAVQRPEPSLEEAVAGMDEDGELPLAA